MATCYVEDGIAVLELNHPPTNTLGPNTRRVIIKTLDEVTKNRDVRAIVLAAKGKGFSSGLDLAYGGSPAKSFKEEPSYPGMCNAVESCTKPVVAAIHGYCLAGGNGLILAAHYRIAHPKAWFAYPEVEVGIFPGDRAVTRMGRLVGLKHQLDIESSARVFTTSEALKIGFIDKISSDNLRADAIEYAKSIASQSLEGRRNSQRPIKDIDAAKAYRETALNIVKRKFKGQIAPVLAIEAMMAAVDYPRDVAFRKQEEIADILFNSGQSKALNYAFFAQRIASKWSIPGVGSDKTLPKPVKTGAVIGAGTMGSGIAMVMLNAGLPVILLEQDKQFLEKGVASIKNLYQGSVRLKKMSQEEADACTSRLRPSLRYEDLHDVDIVIEAVYENMELKKTVFKKLDEICKPDAVLFTNTSSLNIDEIASATKRPEKVMGTHFFSPAYYMKLMENIRGSKTSGETIASAMTFSKKAGKVPVLVGNCFGFVANRMQYRYTDEAYFLVEEGALPHEVDQVIEDFGFPMGPFKLKDLAGLDVNWRVRQERAKLLGIELSDRTRFLDGARHCPLPEILCSKKRFGRKTGLGWYKYGKPGGKEGHVDEHVTELITNYCREINLDRRKISTQEITERCLYGLINEGFKILDEGIAFKPEDIDTIWLQGFSWPKHLGGPMYYANLVGLRKLYERICFYHEQHPTSPHWQPSGLLMRLAERNVDMSEWMTQAPNHRL